MRACVQVKKSAINCLQQFKEELKSDKCRAEVHRRMQRAARDIRFDEVLATACHEDRTKYCVDVQPVRRGHGRGRKGMMGRACRPQRNASCLARSVVLHAFMHVRQKHHTSS